MEGQNYFDPNMSGEVFPCIHIVSSMPAECTSSDHRPPLLPPTSRGRDKGRRAPKQQHSSGSLQDGAGVTTQVLAWHFLPVQSAQSGDDVPAEHVAPGQTQRAAGDSGCAVRGVPVGGARMEQKLQ